MKAQRRSHKVFYVVQALRNALVHESLGLNIEFDYNGGS